MNAESIPSKALPLYRRYLAAVSMICAYAAGHPKPSEVRAALRTLRDIPELLRRLEGRP